MWQECAKLHSIRTGNSPTPTHPVVQNAIHYIADTDCEATLNCLQQILTDTHEFCIHPPQYQFTLEDIAVQKNNNEPTETTAPNAAYFQCLSSGSNGQPNRIRRTHESWISSFNVNAQLAQITNDDSYAIIGRLSHSLALYAALEAVHLGADVHALTELRPDKQLYAIATLASTILYATPTQLRLLCNSVRDTEILDLKSKLQVRQIFCGGGKLDQRTLNLVREVFPQANIKEFYGATETSFITISDNTTPIGSVGRAYPDVDILIKQHDNNSNSGEIWVKSPYLFHEYVERGDQAAFWQDGYVGVGEIGYIDDQGYLYLAGRQSRRINIADTLVYPEQIETLLCEHSMVKNCALVAIKDEKRGHVLVAFVESQKVKEQKNDALKQELLVYLRQQVGTLKAPRDIHFVSSLPLLPSGKPDLLALEELAQKSAHSQTNTNTNL